MNKFHYLKFLLGLLLLPFLQSMQMQRPVTLGVDTLLRTRGFIQDSIAIQVMKVYTYRDSLEQKLVDRKILVILPSKTFKCSIPTPELVKNFSVSSFRIKANGFSIQCAWGGGRNVYKVVFHFVYAENKFFLQELEKQSYGPNQEPKKQKWKVQNPKPIEQFSFFDYLD